MQDLFTIVTGVIGLLSGWTIFIEWRIRTMQTQIQEKIKDRDEIHRIVQTSLRADLARLEAKIDELIKLQIQNLSHDKNN